MRLTWLALVILALTPLQVFAQANAPIGQTVTFTSFSTNGPVVSTTSTAAGVTQWLFTWSTVGTVSAGAIKLQQSTTANFASPSDCIAAQTVTSSGGPTTLTSCTAPYFRLSASTPLTGAGSVTVRLLGFPPGSPANFSGTVTVVQPTAANLNVTVGAITAPATGPTSGLLADSLYSTGGDAGVAVQVSITSSATLAIAARTARRGISVTNLGTVDVYCGFANTVTTSNGDLLLGTKGYSLSYPTNSAVYCITASTSQSVSVAEVY